MSAHDTKPNRIEIRDSGNLKMGVASPSFHINIKGPATADDTDLHTS